MYVFVHLPMNVYLECSLSTAHPPANYLYLPTSHATQPVLVNCIHAQKYSLAHLSYLLDRWHYCMYCYYNLVHAAFPTSEANLPDSHWLHRSPTPSALYFPVLHCMHDTTSGDTLNCSFQPVSTLLPSLVKCTCI